MAPSGTFRSAFWTEWKRVIPPATICWVQSNECATHSSFQVWIRFLGSTVIILASGIAFTNCREMVADSNFLPANIQTMAIRRDFLLKNGLEQVPGGIGEDSLLCNQMMFAARRIEVVPVKVQIYYAERGDSIVNSVTPRFFDKHLLTEVARVKWIVPAGLMDPYIKNRYATYVTRWYFDKLRHADPELAADCARKLYEILKLYDGYYKGGCKEIDAFLAKCRAGDFHGAYELTTSMKNKD